MCVESDFKVDRVAANSHVLVRYCCRVCHVCQAKCRCYGFRVYPWYCEFSVIRISKMCGHANYFDMTNDKRVCVG